MLYIPMSSFTIVPEEFPGNKLGDGLLPCILIVKSDSCLLFPPPSLITFLVTINVPCTLLLTPAACDHVSFLRDSVLLPSFSCFSSSNSCPYDEGNTPSLDFSVADKLKSVSIIEVIKNIIIVKKAISFTTYNHLYCLI